MGRRATKNILTPEEKLQRALASATSFKGNSQLGHIMLLPSKIESRVCLRVYPSTYSTSIQIVCVIPPEDRMLHLRGDTPEKDVIPISTPKLIYAYTVPFSIPNNTPSSGTGYLYRTDSKSSDSLTEALKSVTQYFFPHIYFNESKCGYMCLSYGAPYSPRALNTRFWSSNFSKNWRRTYSANWDLGSGGVLHPATAPEEYQKHQESTSPTRDERCRLNLGKYTDYFELPERPFGVFISSNPDVLDKATPVRKMVLGFVFRQNQEYWVWLKDGKFLHLKPEQVKVL